MNHKQELIFPFLEFRQCLYLSFKNHFSDLKICNYQFSKPKCNKIAELPLQPNMIFCGPSSWSSSQYFVFVFAAATDYLYFPLLDRLWENSSFVSCTKFYNQASNAPQYVAALHRVWIVACHAHFFTDNILSTTTVNSLFPFGFQKEEIVGNWVFNSSTFCYVGGLFAFLNG